eukprot:scaffold44565_cov19-Tisochrysis_lutea.AAC.1
MGVIEGAWRRGLLVIGKAQKGRRDVCDQCLCHNGGVVSVYGSVDTNRQGSILTCLVVLHAFAFLRDHLPWEVKVHTLCVHPSAAPSTRKLSSCGRIRHTLCFDVKLGATWLFVWPAVRTRSKKQNKIVLVFQAGLGKEAEHVQARVYQMSVCPLLPEVGRS